MTSPCARHASRRAKSTIRIAAAMLALAVGAACGSTTGPSSSGVSPSESPTAVAARGGCDTIPDRVAKVHDAIGELARTEGIIPNPVWTIVAQLEQVGVTLSRNGREADWWPMAEVVTYGKLLGDGTRSGDAFERLSWANLSLQPAIDHLDGLCP